MRMIPALDYHNYRITFTVTVDVKVPPGEDDEDDRYETATELAEDFMYQHAPDIDWVLAEIDDITVED